MNQIRRIVGVLLVIAGVAGIVLSLAGIIGVWLVRPSVTSSISTVLGALSTTVDSSNQALNITDSALDSSIQSIDGLSDMLQSMENSVKNTRPAVETVSELLNDTLPATVTSAAESLNTARDAAVSMESAVKQMGTLQTSLNAIPLLNSLVPDTLPINTPEKPLSVSLGELSGNLEGIPESFKDVSRNLSKAAGDLQNLQSNLEEISRNVDNLSGSLKEYKGKLVESRVTLDSLKGLLDKASNSLETVVMSISVILTLIFFCLLMTQVVVIDEGRRFLDREDYGNNGGMPSNRMIQKG